MHCLQRRTFNSNTKFESGSGCKVFASIENKIIRKEDRSLE